MKTLRFGLLAFMPAFAFAGTYHWCGAVDGAWTNPANWQEGTVPGQYKDSGGSVVGEKGDTVIFGDGLTGNAVTTIDFSGQHSVQHLLTEGTRQYTFGTSEDQFISIEPYGTFSAAETAATPPAIVPVKLRLGQEVACTNWAGEQIIVRNNSANEFVMGRWGYNVRSGSGGCTELAIRLEGEGDIRITEPWSQTLGGIFLYPAMKGRLIVDTELKLRSFSPQEVSGTTNPQIVEIKSGATIQPYSCYNYTSPGRAVIYTGEGVYKFGSGMRSGAPVVCETTIQNDITFECAVENVYIGGEPPADAARMYVNNGGACMTMAGDNRMTGIVRVMSGVVLATDSFGLRGTFGGFGDTDFLIGHNATLRHTGGADVTDRIIMLTNNTAGARANLQLQQNGGGVWNVNSPVTLTGGPSGGTLTLKGDLPNAPATFGGTIGAGVDVAKSGSGEWTLAPRNAFEGAISVSGGTLVIGSSMHVPSFTATSGSTVVHVKDGCTLEIDSLSAASDKKINFVQAGTAARVKVNNATVGAGMTGVMLNGHPATFDADLNLVYGEVNANMWQFPVSGDWSDATKWVGGALPDLTRDTYVDAVGGDYTVKIDGSEVTTTNLFINNFGSGKATLLVTNGATLNVRGHTTTDPILVMKEGSRIEVVDSTLRIKDQGNQYGHLSGKSNVSFDNGEIMVRGTSAFFTRGIIASEINTPTTANLNTHFTFGTGNITFDDNSKFATEVENTKPSSVFYHTFQASRAGETSAIRLNGNSYIAHPTAPWELHLRGNSGRAVFEIDTGYPNTMTGWNGNNIGNGTGVGELLITRGKMKLGGYDYLRVGTPGTDGTTWAAICATGRVVVAEGAYLEAQCGNPSETQFLGVQIGHATALTSDPAKSYVYGEMLIAGEFKQQKGVCLIGTGAAGHGLVRQTGGSALIGSNPSTDARYRGHMAVGAFGGDGRYELTGGEFTTKYNVYVGGVFTNDLGRLHPNIAKLETWHDARGTVSVGGGSFTSTERIILGRDGTGWLEMTGDGVVGAREIVVSNTVGQAASGLRFTATADRKCGAFAAGTKLSFLPGAKVVVDVSAVASQKNPRNVPVWNLDVAPEGIGNVEFELEGVDDLRLSNSLKCSPDGRSLLWNVVNGTVLIVR